MRTLLIISLALVATAFAYEVEDIPEFMRDRLDRFVALRRQWEQKWLTMSPEERVFYERMIMERLEHIPETIRRRIHEKFEEMPQEDRVKLRSYIYQRFPELDAPTDVSEQEELDYIIDQLPEMVREKISDFISMRFQAAAAYENVEDADFVDFPEVAQLVEIPTPDEEEGVPYSEYVIPDEIVQRLDSFLEQREHWRRRWEGLPEEKREAFEKYIKSKIH